MTSWLLMTFDQVGLVTEPELDFPGSSSCEFFFFLSTKYFLHFKGVKIEVHIVCVHVYSFVQSCLILCDPMDCSLPGSSVHGLLQARIWKWVAISSSRVSSQASDWTLVSCVSCIGRLILYPRATWEAHVQWQSLINPIEAWAIRWRVNVLVDAQQLQNPPRRLKLLSIDWLISCSVPKKWHP